MRKEVNREMKYRIRPEVLDKNREEQQLGSGEALARNLGISLRAVQGLRKADTKSPDIRPSHAGGKQHPYQRRNRGRLGAPGIGSKEEEMLTKEQETRSARQESGRGECLMVCVGVPNPHEEIDQNDYCDEAKCPRPRVLPSRLTMSQTCRRLIGT